MMKQNLGFNTESKQLFGFEIATSFCITPTLKHLRCFRHFF